MATISQTSINVAGGFDVTPVTMTASDTLSYTADKQQILLLRNTTVDPVEITIDGAGSTTISPAGYGGTLSVAAGKTLTVPGSGYHAVRLDTIKAFLSGVVTVTGGVGLEAILLGTA